MNELSGKCVAILATDGFEQSELMSPRETLSEAGAGVKIVSPQTESSPDSIRGWDRDQWGESIEVDLALEDAEATSFDALVLPGGLINPDKLRSNERALEFVSGFFDQNKVVAAICHAPWILINAGCVVGRNITSYPSLRVDLENAGAQWHDEAVVVDNGGGEAAAQTISLTLIVKPLRRFLKPSNGERAQDEVTASLVSS